MSVTITAPSIDAPLVISSFENEEDVRPKRLTTSWTKLGESLVQHRESETKTVRLWSPAEYRSGATRSSAGVVCWTVAAFDIDDGTDAQTLGWWLGDLEYVIHSTFSYAPPEVVKFRVVVRLEEAIPATEYSDVWRRANQHLFHGHVDPSTKDLARMLYVPTCRPGAERVAIHHPGKPLNWRALPPLPQPKPLPKRAGATDGSESTDDHRRAAALLAKWENELAGISSPKSGRHNRLLQLARAAGGLVASRLLDEHDVRDRLYAACLTNGHVASRGERDVQRTLEDGLSHGNTDPWVPDDLPDAPAWTVRQRFSRNGHHTVVDLQTSKGIYEVNEVNEISLSSADLSSYSSFTSYQTPWPEPLAGEAFYGLAGDLVRAIQPFSEADPAALLAHALAILGVYIGANVHAVAGDAMHPARLNTVVVGVTSKGRKGTSSQPVLRTIRLTEEVFATSRVMPGLSSGEGLIWQVRDAITKRERVKQEGGAYEYADAEADPGVADKRLVVLEPEFASVLRMLQRDGNTLSAVVRLAWDSGDLRTLTKNSPAVATGAHIGIVGHVTRDELLRYLDRSELASGFANRFLWFAAKRAQTLPDGEKTPDGVLLQFAQQLRAVASWAKTGRSLRRDSEAAAVWHEVYPKLSEGVPGLFGAATSRAEAQVLRLSVLYAALDCSVTIHAQHLLAALAVWKYAEESARWIFGDAIGDSTADTILSALRQGADLTLEQISSDLFGRNVSRNRIQQALGRLLAVGLARPEKRQTGGRPAEVWRAR